MRIRGAFGNFDRRPLVVDLWGREWVQALDGFLPHGRFSTGFIAMRMQHVAQAASGLSMDSPDRVKAKAVIVAEVERLRWRIWNGKAKNAQRSIDRIRKVMPVFKGERGHRPKGMSPCKLWSALHAADRYLRGQSAWLVNYAERHRAGLRVGTSITEGTANFLVNRRMNKAQQMRWSPRGADNPAQGPLCGLQRDARVRVRLPIWGVRKSKTDACQGGMIPQSLDSPTPGAASC